MLSSRPSFHPVAYATRPSCFIGNHVTSFLTAHALTYSVDRNGSVSGIFVAGSLEPPDAAESPDFPCRFGLVCGAPSVEGDEAGLEEVESCEVGQDLLVCAG